MGTGNDGGSERGQLVVRSLTGGRKPPERCAEVGQTVTVELLAAL